MSSSIRPRLVVLRGAEAADSPDARAALEVLQSAFDVVEVENADAARRLIEADASSPFLSLPIGGDVPGGGEGLALESVLQQIGEGVGVVTEDGTLEWANDRLKSADDSTRAAFIERCGEARAAFNRDVLRGGPMHPTRTYAFVRDESHYELVVSPSGTPDEEGRIRAVVGVLWDVTATRRLQQKIDAIDAAGAELMRIDADSIQRLDMAQRLRILEEKIIASVRDLLEFDNFEIRLLDRQSNRLELVVAVGISPLKIGEVMHAVAEGEGISGWVATTGRSYICADVRRDPLYREGLEEAASSLTVPLRLHDEVIGVFNIESLRPDAFDDDDRQFAEIFGRYVAMAMHILDLLVVERYTTNEEVSANVLGEIEKPIAAIIEAAEALDDVSTERPELRARLDAIHAAAAEVRSRLDACRRGPRTILGAEQELQRHEVDPAMQGRRVLVADNDEEIRVTMERVLSQRGCDVTVCPDGSTTIDAVEREGPFDLVISDIKMPDRTGYEIFRTSKRVQPGTPVILMTGFGYDPHHSIIRASQEGLQALLFKPFQAAQLIEAMQRAFERKDAASEPRRPDDPPRSIAL